MLRFSFFYIKLICGLKFLDAKFFFMQSRSYITLQNDMGTIISPMFSPFPTVFRLIPNLVWGKR